MWIDVKNDERAFVHVNGRPTRYLVSGRYFVFEPFARVEVVRYSLKSYVADLAAEELALVPEGDVELVEVSESQRAVVRRRNRPVAWLGQGRHVVWLASRVMGAELTPEIGVDVLDVSGVTVEPLGTEVRALVPADEYVEATVPSGAVAVRFVDGVLDTVLPPGRHGAFKITKRVELAVMDLRERTLSVNGQEVMSRDRVSLRVNVAAVYRIADPVRVASVAREPDELVYLAVQLAARELLAARSLDEILAERDGLSGQLASRVRVVAEKLGLLLVELGIKDLVLPGDMRALLNRVIEAQKEAEANVIARREETAAVRSMANTAKVLAESPMLLRLKELEAYKELASRVGRVHLVVGDRAIEKLGLSSVSALPGGEG
ncbi:MAG: slipin family protein [Deltaproteobacteria bacterium]|nr:slipin family protein [Deltaproteobacteria bacterium]